MKRIFNLRAMCNRFRYQGFNDAYKHCCLFLTGLDDEKLELKKPVLSKATKYLEPNDKGTPLLVLQCCIPNIF
jgi:hypothetical protein